MICHRIFGFSGDCQVNVNVDFCMISSWLFSRMLSILMKVLFFIFIFVSFDDFSYPTSIEYYTTYKHSLTFDQIFINSLPFSKIQSFISSLLFYLLLNHKIESYFLEKQTIQPKNKQFNNQGYLNHLQHSSFYQNITYLLQILFGKRQFVNKSIVQLRHSPSLCNK